MAIGERIKRIRNLRKLTQKELGLAIGFDENTADVRVAQYESNTRTPKEEMLRKIADVLDVNYRSIYEPTLYAAEDIIYTLFELDEHYSIRLHEVTYDDELGFPETHIAVDFHTRLLDDFMKEWLQRKKDLADGIISKAEYMEWKLNWPQTADDCEKFEPKKQWRKPPETTD
jgi:transcriptional regulator with XRE-family HTH domain